jgi:hypothetical protein
MILLTHDNSLYAFTLALAVCYHGRVLSRFMECFHGLYYHYTQKSTGVTRALITKAKDHNRCFGEY